MEALGRYKHVVPVPWVSWHGRTELAELPGMGTNVAHNSHKLFVGKHPTKYPGYVWLCTYPTDRTQPRKFRHRDDMNMNTKTVLIFPYNMVCIMHVRTGIPRILVPKLPGMYFWYEYQVPRT